ncbi:MAG: GDP-mannose 4,6-dehydratase [Solirubrobacteraceae bacterium]
MATDQRWTGRTVLGTGAAGFIGSHLAEELVRRGARVRAFVRYTSAGRWGWLDDSELVSDMEVLAGDIRDPETLGPAMAGAEVVFHLAALIAIPYSYLTPLAYVRTNVEGTTNVLEAARAAGVGRVVHTSTSEVYGTAQTVPISEAHPLVGQSPYSASKIGADKIAESFHAAFDLPVVVLRPFNTFGPRQSARAVIPTIVTQLLAGHDVRLGALAPTRDLTFVADTADGFIAAGAAPAAVGRTINLGVGREISIGDLNERIHRLMGREPMVSHDALRDRPAASEVERLLSDNALARELLDWEPRHTLDAGLEATIEWLSRHLDRYRPGTYQV